VAFSAISRLNGTLPKTRRTIRLAGSDSCIWYELLLLLRIREGLAEDSGLVLRAADPGLLAAEEEDDALDVLELVRDRWMVAPKLSMSLVIDSSRSVYFSSLPPLALLVSGGVVPSSPSSLHIIKGHIIHTHTHTQKGALTSICRRSWQAWTRPWSVWRPPPVPRTFQAAERRPRRRYARGVATGSWPFLPRLDRETKK